MNISRTFLAFVLASVSTIASAMTLSDETLYPGSAVISNSEMDIISVVQFGIGNLPPVDEGIEYVIRDIRVRLDLDHSWASDVEATLTFNGLTVGLFHDAGRSADFASGNGAEYWLHSEGDALPLEGIIPSGVYRPSVGDNAALRDDLSLFAGMNPTGFWMLRLSDDFASDDGTFYGWKVELELDTVVVTPEPHALWLLLGWIPFHAGRRRVSDERVDCRTP